MERVPAICPEIAYRYRRHPSRCVSASPYSPKSEKLYAPDGELSDDKRRSTTAPKSVRGVVAITDRLRAHLEDGGYRLTYQQVQSVVSNFDRFYFNADKQMRCREIITAQAWMDFSFSARNLSICKKLLISFKHGWPGLLDAGAYIDLGLRVRLIRGGSFVAVNDCNGSRRETSSRRPSHSPSRAGGHSA